MSDVDLDTLSRDLDSLQGTYQMRFANQPRITRNLDVLDGLIQRAEAISSQLAAVKPNGSAERLESLRESATERLERFRNERKAIAEAQQAGAPAIEATLLGTRTNLIIFNYRRHYAGKSRSTRDLSRLEEMMQELEGLQKEMTALSSTYGQTDSLSNDQQVLREHLQLFRREGDAIAQAQAQGSIEERAGLLGQLANNQFEIYRVHFAGKQRISRRPELLVRVIGNLEFIHSEMKALRDRGLRADFNLKNMQIVAERIEAYRNELDEIRKVRADSSIDQVLDSLASAANDAMSAYGSEFAGQSRTTRNADRLGELCDEMYELETQMSRLVQHTSGENATRYQANLEIVRDALSMFEREHQEIVKAQEGSK